MGIKESDLLTIITLLLAHDTCELNSYTIKVYIYNYCMCIFCWATISLYVFYKKSNFYCSH